MPLLELLTFARANFAERSPISQSERAANQADPAAPRPDWQLVNGDVVEVLPPPTLATDVELGQRRNVRGELPVIYGEFQANPQDLTGREIDVLASYLPFHFWDESAWGIYVREYGLELLAAGLNGGTVKPGDELLICAAFEALFQHEFFHCQLESAATRIEAVTGVAAYRPHYDSVSARSHEEAVANAAAFRQFRRWRPDLAWTLGGWMETQPNGYADFGKWVKAMRQAKQETAGHLASTQTRGKTTAPLPLEVLFGSVDSREVRTYLVRDGRGPIGLPFTFPRDLGIAVMIYTRDHRPPHIHVKIPSGSRSRRLLWDQLTPLSPGESLTHKEDRIVRSYVDRHRAEIQEFANRVPWTP